MRIEWRISFEQKKTEVFGVIKLIANRQTSGHFSKIIDEINGQNCDQVFEHWRLLRVSLWNEWEKKCPH